MLWSTYTEFQSWDSCLNISLQVSTVTVQYNAYFKFNLIFAWMRKLKTDARSQLGWIVICSCWRDCPRNAANAVAAVVMNITSRFLWLASCSPSMWRCWRPQSILAVRHKVMPQEPSWGFVLPKPNLTGINDAVNNYFCCCQPSNVPLYD